jgi:hypothetical protein
MTLRGLVAMAQTAVGPDCLVSIVPIVVACAQVTLARPKGHTEGLRYPANQLRDTLAARGLRIVYERNDERARTWFFAIDGQPFRTDF